MKLTERITKILTEQRISAAVLAETAGIGKSAMYRIIRGETSKISTKTAIRIETKFPQYSFEWLTKEEVPEKSEKVRSENSTSDGEIGLIKEGVKFNKEELALHFAINEDEFMKMKIFSNVIEKRVVERILEIVKEGGLKEYL